MKWNYYSPLAFDNVPSVPCSLRALDPFLRMKNSNRVNIIPKRGRHIPNLTENARDPITAEQISFNCYLIDILHASTSIQR